MKRIGTELDGLAWEIEIDPENPGPVTLYRAPHPLFENLECVAFGRWDGERIDVQVIRLGRYSAPLRADKYLATLADMLRTELQP